jgi:hypothetical protein
MTRAGAMVTLVECVKRWNDAASNDEMMTCCFRRSRDALFAALYCCHESQDPVIELLCFHLLQLCWSSLSHSIKTKSEKSVSERSDS